MFIVMAIAEYDLEDYGGFNIDCLKRNFMIEDSIQSVVDKNKTFTDVEILSYLFKKFKEYEPESVNDLMFTNELDILLERYQDDKTSALELYKNIIVDRIKYDETLRIESFIKSSSYRKCKFYSCEIDDNDIDEIALEILKNGEIFCYVDCLILPEGD